MLRTHAIRAALAALAISTITPAHAAICFQGNAGLPNHKLASDNKWAVSEKRAKKKARGSWNDKAQSLMGSSRANWGNAQNTSYYCHKGFGWHCTAYARPCM